MKIDPDNWKDVHADVKRSFTLENAVRFLCGLILATVCCVPASATEPNAAENLIEQVIDRLGNGEAFDCLIRHRVYTAGREVVGVGEYVQVGGGTGHFSLHVKTHDGTNKHMLHQISDGRLAWTREEIDGVVFVSRANVGWLDEAARTQQPRTRIKPSMRVGGPSEMLDTIRRHYDLKLGQSELKGRQLWVIVGELNDRRRAEIVNVLQGQPWPKEFPTRVHVAIAKSDDPESGTGKGLPIRIEHFSDPIEVDQANQDDSSPTVKERPMISLLEFYSIRPVQPPPVQRFRYENQDVEVDFVDETHLYELRFGIQGAGT